MMSTWQQFFLIYNPTYSKYIKSTLDRYNTSWSKGAEKYLDKGQVI